MVDLYCERVGSGLWGEPVNASTNLAFFLAAWVIWKLGRRAQTLSDGVWLLIVLLVTIGIGSSLFHTFATTWARVLDAAPILLFQLTYLWLYSREIIKMRFGYAAGLLAAFLVAAYFGRQFPNTLDGSLIYAPAFVLILSLGLYHYRAQKAERFAVLAAAGVFLLAIFFRSIDNAVCSSFPVGTHFLWHLLIPVVLYLFMRGLLLNLAKTSREA
jgi:Ceramidase